MQLFIKLLVYWFYRFLIATWRVRMHVHPQVREFVEKKHPFILAHWHCDIQALLLVARIYPIAMMISRSKDGDIVSFVAERLGGKAARGSSGTKKGGSSALKEMIRLTRGGRIPSLAIDGPRGPKHLPKFGVFELSKICSASIVPIVAVCDPVLTLRKSWDQSYIPYPFSRVTIYLAEPINAPTKFLEDDRELLPKALANRMDGARQHLSNLIATPKGGC